MTTITVTTGATDGDGVRLFGARGRHRKPRPRKVLLAAGGLALAAGALSLVRMTPDTSGNAFGIAEADPQAPAPDADTDTDADTDAGIGTGTDRATNAAATVGSVPQAHPSSTATMGGVAAIPTPGVRLAPAGSATAVPLPRAAAPTTIPEAPNTPVPAAPTQHPQATTAAPQPQPAPTSARTTPPPAPAQTPTAQPTHAPRPGLCVPIVGLCVQQHG